MAVSALIWANSPWSDHYFALRDFRWGYAPWHLELSLGAWAADGLLAIFFFLVGLELKRELITGDLRSISTAVVPVAAAIGGVVVPALLYLVIVGSDAEAQRGWAIPTATDIAFAVSVLALIGSHLPSPLRIFLLTLAVVDDLLAISIIAIFYTDSIAGRPLLIALVAIALYGVVAQVGRRMFSRYRLAAWILLLPLGSLAWAFMHASGIHATIAGVLLGFTVPVLAQQTGRQTSDTTGLAEQLEHRFRPLSAGLAVPVFAFFSAGVTVGGVDGLRSAYAAPLTTAIIVALVVGKPLGILAATWLMTRLRGIRLDPSLTWVDLIGVGLLAGIGFTVSLLISELSFDPVGDAYDQAKIAILSASLLAAFLASAILLTRNNHYRKLSERDATDDDHDGIPDVYQQDHES